MSTSLKDQGNEEFKKENYLKAAALYAQAVKEDPQNAVLYSNKSAALLKLKKVTKALEDAETCIKLKPDWDKGYFRKGAVLEEMGKLAEALKEYEHSLQLSPDNRELSLKIRSLTKLFKVKSTEKEKQEKQQHESLATLVASAAGGGDVGTWAVEMLDHMMGSIAESDTAFDPSLHWLPGTYSEAHDEAHRHVRMREAFSSPELLQGFVGEMREMGAKFDAAAVLAIVPRPAVAFPQVWTKPSWPKAKDAKGVFLQLEAKAAKKKFVWFVPVQDKAVGRAEELDADYFGMLPALLR